MSKDHKFVLPENQVQLTQAARQADIAYVSTMNVEETPVFNSMVHDSQFQAQAGVQAQHLNLAAAHVAGGQQNVMEIKNQLEPFAAQLRGLKLPDTRVNIDNIKMEIPFEIKRYAGDLNQGMYAQIMTSLLGKERMVEVWRHTTKANQGTVPALWLNQAVCIETKKPYVYTMSRHIPEGIKKSGIDDMPMDMQEKANQYLEAALGPELWVTISQIAGVNQITAWAAFVLITDVLLNDRQITSVPTTAQSVWAGIVDEHITQPTSDNTADKLRGR